MATTPASAPAEPRRGRAERLIEVTATGLGESVAWLAARGVLFAVFLVIWVAFGLAVIANPAALAQAWDVLGGLPLIVQLPIWVLFLPVMAALWVWQASGWADLIRVAGVVALAAWTLLVMKPQWLGSRPPLAIRGG